MKRRALLAALGAGVSTVAGCTTDLATDSMPVGDAGSTPTDTPGDTPTDTPHDDPEFPSSTSIVDLRTATRTYALGPTDYRTDDGGSVAVRFRGTATPDHPVRMQATLTNENDFENTFALEWLPPFGRSTSAAPHPHGVRYGDDHTYRAALVTVPTESNDLATATPGVTRDADDLWRAKSVGQWVPETVRLGPGERVGGDFWLVGHPDGAGTGRPTGVYEFARPDGRSLRVTVWNTDSPGPGGESRFAGLDVPPLDDERSTGWYHEADASTPSYVRPGTERTDLPAAVPFTFVNHGREATGCGHWQCYKLVDGEWFGLGPFVHTADCRMVPPGGSKRVLLRATHDEALGCGTCGCGDAFTFDFLGGGRYAVVGGYGIGVSDSGALVEFDAPPVAVRPTDDVSTSSGDGTVTVTSPRYGDGEGSADATLVVERAASADRRLIAEQTMQRRGLRNTLPFFEPGVDRVELRTDESVVRRATRFGSERFRFRFDGRAYVAAGASE